MGFLDKLLGRTKETAATVAEKAAPAVDKAGEVASGAVDKAGEFASGAVDKAKDVVGAGQGEAEQLAADAGAAVEGATDAVTDAPAGEGAPPAA